MKRILLIRPQAEQDLHEAFQWYEKQHPGLGEDFLLSIEASLNNLLDNPQSFPVVFGKIRRCLVRRFPYAIFYISEKDKINVLAFFHCSRNPESWKKRPGKKS